LPVEPMKAPASRVPVAVSPVSSDAEEGRRFYQQRLALFAGCVAAISGAFMVVGVVMRGVAFAALDVRMSHPVPHVIHLATTLLAAAVWLAARTLTMSLPTARAVDATAAVALNMGYALMGVAFAVDDLSLQAGMDPHYAMVIGLLACTYVVLSRAVAMPSAPGRTMWISALAMIPVVVATAVSMSRSYGGAALFLLTADVGAWAVAAVVLAAISSRVIFGLRTEVAKVKRLGQYTLDQKIGEGGMGVVYRAHHAMLRRPTAIKLRRLTGSARPACAASSERFS
jgi:serine/threonine-protein kinase